jgi:phosphoenolpyruvate carboxykinase (GTP)
VPNLLAKIDRVEQIYKTRVPDTPQIVFDIFNTQRKRLTAARNRLSDYISPFDL